MDSPDMIRGLGVNCPASRGISNDDSPLEFGQAIGSERVVQPCTIKCGLDIDVKYADEVFVEISIVCDIASNAFRARLGKFKFGIEDAKKNYLKCVSFL